MTEKLKLVDLKVVFKSFSWKNPLKIYFENKEYITIFEINEKFIDRDIEFQIKNFSGKDRSQLLQIYFIINGKKQWLDRSVFYPYDIKSQIKENLDIIFEDGILKINLSKEWFGCNIFNGSCLHKDKSNYIHWAENYEQPNYDRLREKDLEEYDIACIGASATFGQVTNPYETWPYHLEKITNKICGNFGVDGIDHFTIMHNTEYFLKNYETKILIMLFGPYFFLLPKKNKIDDYYMYHIIGENNNDIANKKYNLQIVKYQQWCLKNYKIIDKILLKKIINIKKICEDKSILLLPLYSNKKIKKYDVIKTNFEPIYIEDFGRYSNENNIKFASALPFLFRKNI